MSPLRVVLLLVLFQLTACGQGRHQSFKVSYADSVKVRMYEQKSIFYQHKKPDSAVYFAEKGLKLSRKLHYLKGEALLLSQYSDINGQYGNLELARKQQREALALFAKLKDEASVTRASASLGLLEGRLGNINGGLNLLRKALESDKKRKDIPAMIQAYTMLGELLEISGNTNAAFDHYRKAEQLNNGYTLNDDYYSLIGRLGKLYAQKGNHQKSLYYYKKGISKSLASGHKKEHITFLRHTAVAYDSLGNRQQALAYHQRSIDKARQFGLREEEARSLMGMASALQDQDAGQSIRHLNNALAIAHTIGNKQLISEIYYSLSTLYRQQSNLKEALAALDAHYKLVDSLQKANAGHRIAALQSSYTLSEFKLRADALELDNLKRIEERDMTGVAAAGILILLIILGLYYYKTKRLNKKLGEANQIKDKLFSIIGHDLRSPLGGITQMLALMESGELSPEEQIQVIPEMRKQGDSTLEILNDLLKWGEARIKGTSIYPSDFHPVAVIAKNIEVLHKQAEDKEVTIVDFIPPGLTVNGDVNHFDFIIRNLISNAIKFSYPGRTIEITSQAGEAGKITFSVKDQGKGISKEQLKRFQTTNIDTSAGTAGEKGTGIGLMLSREFITANHGKLWVESEEGKGSKFYFTFGRAI